MQMDMESSGNWEDTDVASHKQAVLSGQCSLSVDVPLSMTSDTRIQRQLEHVLCRMEEILDRRRAHQGSRGYGMTSSHSSARVC